jgi:hypothetical protein
MLWYYLVLFLVLYQLTHAVAWKMKRKRLYAQAAKRARETGKKLLVIGDPDNGLSNKLFGRDYDYGDECVDLTGCPNAPLTTKVYKNRLESILPRLDLNKRVVFISCVLEQIDDIDRVISILHTMDPHDLFILNVDPRALEAWVYPNFLTGEPSIKRRVFYKNGQITYASN